MATGPAVLEIEISRCTSTRNRQSLFSAFACSVATIPISAFGHPGPMLACAAMAFSSVSVASNALLLRRWQLRQG